MVDIWPHRVVNIIQFQRSVRLVGQRAGTLPSAEMPTRTGRCGFITHDGLIAALAEPGGDQAAHGARGDQQSRLLPIFSAASCCALIVGSSPYTSSPTSATLRFAFPAWLGMVSGANR